MSRSNRDDDLPITLGIEEEFFLIDPDSGDLLRDPDPRIFEAGAADAGPHDVVHEFLRSQIESNTEVCDSVAMLREALKATQRAVAAPRSWRRPHIRSPRGNRNCRRRSNDTSVPSRLKMRV